MFNIICQWIKTNWKTTTFLKKGKQANESKKKKKKKERKREKETLTSKSEDGEQLEISNLSDGKLDVPKALSFWRVACPFLIKSNLYFPYDLEIPFLFT